jgi:hypothetical protein
MEQDKPRHQMIQTSTKERKDEGRGKGHEEGMGK